MQAHQQQFRVARLCRALHVSRSGYYDWQRREPSARQQEDIKLLAAIERTHQNCRQAYGAVKNVSDYIFNIPRVSGSWQETRP